MTIKSLIWKDESHRSVQFFSRPGNLVPERGQPETGAAAADLRPDLFWFWKLPVGIWLRRSRLELEMDARSKLSKTLPYWEISSPQTTTNHLIKIYFSILQNVTALLVTNSILYDSVYHAIDIMKSFSKRK